ncbi:MAG TPA: ATP-binding protein, partial [Thermoanaerobaculia bacterium]|nr:ATP-binding protein [Thermoanaerobaculia bacterium]
MSESIPLGEKEDHRREFKSAEALKNPEIVARGVVALLIAEGGEVWVGLREESERAVAIEPIANPEREGRRLLDYLVDTIEPSPLGGEIGVEPVPSEDGFVLRVTARPQEGRKPYAFSKKGGWHFVVRIGARTRPMTREEIQRRFSSANSTQGQAVEKAKKRLLEERE